MKIRVIKEKSKRHKNKTIVGIITSVRTDDNVLVPSSVEYFEGVARCLDEDKYNYEIGKKIALARAEIKAFKYYSKKLKSFANKYKHLYESSTELYTKLDRQIAHNKEYISDIISGSIEIDAGCNAL